MKLKQINDISNWIIRKIQSKYFIIVILVLFFIQASWIAVSFQYPMIYDEIFHIPVIEIFSNQISPFISNQPMEYDRYGNLANNSAGLYHYLMSIPYRIISLFTDSFPIKVIILRLINVGLATLGIYLFYKLFRRIKVSRIYINIGLLLFILLPVVPLTSAHVNYDNLLLPLVALFLLLSINILLNKSPKLIDLFLIILVGIFATLIKVTFLPILFVGLIYLLVNIFISDGKVMVPKKFMDINSFKNPKAILLVVTLVIFSGMFTAKYISNLIIYKNPQPNCIQTQIENRCLAEPLTLRELTARESKSTRSPLHITEYASHWYDRMVIYSVMTGNTTTVNNEVKIGAHKSIMRTIVYFGCIFSLGVILYAWKSMKLDILTWGYLLLLVVATIVSTFIFNYLTFLETYSAFAIQPRYLLPILPIILVLSSMSFGYIFRSIRPIGAILFICTLIILTQGGGVITHISMSDASWYWQYDPLININEKMQILLSRIVRL